MNDYFPDPKRQRLDNILSAHRKRNDEESCELAVNVTFEAEAFKKDEALMEINCHSIQF